MILIFIAGIPYADQVIEDGGDGENNTEDVEIEFEETSNVINTLGSGEWDYIGTYYFYYQNLVMTSHGGDAKVNIEQPGEDFYNYVLMEDDGSAGDDYVTEWDSNAPDINGRNVYDVIVEARSFVDGDNGTAEFYIKELNGYNEDVTCLYICFLSGVVVYTEISNYTDPYDTPYLMLMGMESKMDKISHKR